MDWTNTFYPGPAAEDFSPPPYFEPQCIYDYNYGNYDVYVYEDWELEQEENYEANNDDYIKASARRILEGAERLLDTCALSSEGMREVADILRQARAIMALESENSVSSSFDNDICDFSHHS